MKLKMKINASSFERKMALFKRAKKGGMQDAVRKAAAAFARTALLYTPPGMKSKKKGLTGKEIAPELYLRPMAYLPKLAQEKRLLPADREALKKGYLFKVFKKKGGKIVGEYFKTGKEAESVRRIKTRGLYKAGYSINFQSVGMKVPPAVRALAAKASGISPLSGKINKLRETQGPSVVELSITNMAYSAGASFESIAKRQGERAGERTLLRLTRKFFKDRKIEL